MFEAVDVARVSTITPHDELAQTRRLRAHGSLQGLPQGAARRRRNSDESARRSSMGEGTSVASGPLAGPRCSSLPNRPRPFCETAIVRYHVRCPLGESGAGMSIASEIKHDMAGFAARSVERLT